MKFRQPLLTQVTDHVYCVQRRDFLSCFYLVLRDSGVVLVDAGIDPDGADVRAGLAEVHRTMSDVEAILLTHWHNDHSSGAAVVREESGARVYFHRDGADKFSRAARAGGLRGWMAAQLPASGFWAPFRGLLELAPPRSVTATTFVGDDEIIEEEFRVLETPGHDIGHVSFYYEPEKVLFAGDALAVSHNRVALMSRFLTADKNAARDSILRCLKLELKAICPGHQYPLIDPSQDQMRQLQEKLRSMRWWPIIGC